MGKAVCLIVCLALVFLAGSVHVSAESTSESTTEWWMFMKFLNHTAWDGVPYSVIPGLNNTSYTTGGVIYSSPAIANGYVYVGSKDNKLYQLNASNVSQFIASYTTGDIIDSSPAIANGYVYVGSHDNELYQLNASNISQFIASYTTDSYIYSSSPAVANGYVYIGGYDHKLYQLNASNVSQFIASYATGGVIYSSPAIANGYVYIGSWDKKLYQLNASNVSKLIASYTTGDAIESSPAIANGYVYVGSDYHALYQLNASNVSKLIASYIADVGSFFYSSPAIANGYVYIGNWDKKLYQLNASNVSQFIASYTAGDSFGSSSPAVANGYVYIGNDNNELYQLNASNVSQFIASYATIGIMLGYSSPAVANGYVYVGSDDYNLYQLIASNISSPNPESYPQFSNYWDDNATLIGSGTGYFNVTLANTNGTVLLEINGVNVTATNISDVYNANYTFATNGTYSYKWHSWGNGASHLYNGSATRSYTIKEVDTIAPSINLISPLNRTYNNSTLLVNFTATDNINVDKLWFNNGTANNSYSTPVSVNVGQGSHTFIFYANDTSGNLNSTSVTFFVDSIAPVISLISPSNGTSSTNTSWTFMYNVSDISRTNCSLFIDGKFAKFNSSVNISGGANIFVNDSIAVGDHNWSVSCTDVVGNTNGSGVRNFTVLPQAANPDQSASPSGGGGGSGSTVSASAVSLFALKIIVPEPLSLAKNSTIIVPISIFNDGQLSLNNVSLSASVSRSGKFSSDIVAFLSEDKINLLSSGQKKNLTLTLQISSSADSDYVVQINADVAKPIYSDFSKLFVSIENNPDVANQIVFLQTLIANNPECAEMKENIDNAKNLYNLGNFSEAAKILNESISGCRELISQEAVLGTAENSSVLGYVAAGTVALFFVWFAVYMVRQRRARSKLRE